MENIAGGRGDSHAPGSGGFDSAVGRGRAAYSDARVCVDLHRRAPDGVNAYASAGIRVLHERAGAATAVNRVNVNRRTRQQHTVKLLHVAVVGKQVKVAALRADVRGLRARGSADRNAGGAGDADACAGVDFPLAHAGVGRQDHARACGGAAAGQGDGRVGLDQGVVVDEQAPAGAVAVVVGIERHKAARADHDALLHRVALHQNALGGVVRLRGEVDVANALDAGAGEAQVRRVDVNVPGDRIGARADGGRVGLAHRAGGLDVDVHVAGGQYLGGAGLRHGSRIGEIDPDADMDVIRSDCPGNALARVGIRIHAQVAGQGEHVACADADVLAGADATHVDVGVDVHVLLDVNVAVGVRGVQTDAVTRRARRRARFQVARRGRVHIALDDDLVAGRAVVPVNLHVNPAGHGHAVQRDAGVLVDQQVHSEQVRIAQIQRGPGHRSGAGNAEVLSIECGDRAEVVAGLEDHRGTAVNAVDGRGAAGRIRIHVMAGQHGKASGPVQIVCRAVNRAVRIERAAKLVNHDVVSRSNRDAAVGGDAGAGDIQRIRVGVEVDRAAVIRRNHTRALHQGGPAAHVAEVGVGLEDDRRGPANVRRVQRLIDRDVLGGHDQDAELARGRGEAGPGAVAGHAHAVGRGSVIRHVEFNARTNDQHATDVVAVMVVGQDLAGFVCEVAVAVAGGVGAHTDVVAGGYVRIDVDEGIGINDVVAVHVDRRAAQVDGDRVNVGAAGNRVGKGADRAGAALGERAGADHPDVAATTSAPVARHVVHIDRRSSDVAVGGVADQDVAAAGGGHVVAERVTVGGA